MRERSEDVTLGSRGTAVWHTFPPTDPEMGLGRWEASWVEWDSSCALRRLYSPSSLFLPSSFQLNCHLGIFTSELVEVELVEVLPTRMLVVVVLDLVTPTQEEVTPPSRGPSQEVVLTSI